MAYIEDCGYGVVDRIALEISDNLLMGRRDPMALLEDLGRLDTTKADAVILSACVQMPPLIAIEPAQDRLGLPVTSAAACTARKILEALQLDPIAPGAGAILSQLLDNPLSTLDGAVQLVHENR